MADSENCSKGARGIHPLALVFDLEQLNVNSLLDAIMSGTRTRAQSHI